MEKRLQYIGDEMCAPSPNPARFLVCASWLSPSVRPTWSFQRTPLHCCHSHDAHFCRKRTQNHLNDLEGRCEEKKAKIMQLQAQLRKGAAKPEGAPAAAQ